MILVWSPGKGSPIHDHADAHCLMKVLKGSLKETRFEFPEHGAPESIKETIFQENEVTYMSDELGLHKISNPDPEKLAVSLHRKSLRSAKYFTVFSSQISVHSPECEDRRLLYLR